MLLTSEVQKRRGKGSSYAWLSFLAAMEVQREPASSACPFSEESFFQAPSEGCRVGFCNGLLRLMVGRPVIATVALAAMSVDRCPSAM